ncbi:hypothetical protein C8R43DRAFT_1139469 [Mycena crocata]|nr:hypothetical protein C8R43DRAFT_1139469 [Mycena crocata]
MSTFDQIFGTLLLGTWAASFLFGLVTAEAYKYFTTFPNDPWKRKGLVILTLCLTVAALIGDYANTYLPTVTYWGNTEAIATVYWPVCHLQISLSLSDLKFTQLPLYSMMNTILAFIVESFLIHRFYTLSKNIWATLFLYCLVLLAVAGYLIGFIPLVRGFTLADREKARIGALINFIAFVVCDVLTAAGLIWKLRSMRSSFQETRTFMNRVIVGAIHTGSATSLCSLILLITFLNNPQTNLATFFIFLFAPLYALTLLFNFNLRRTTSGVGTSKTSESRNGGNNVNGIIMDGIRVQRTAIVTMDPTDSELEAARRRVDEDHSIKKDPDAESYTARKVTVTTFNGN